MVVASDELRQGLADSSFLTTRDAESPPLVLLPLEFENGSNERLSRVDQWAMITRVLHAPGMIELLDEHNVRVRIPLEQEPLFARFDLAEEMDEIEFSSSDEPVTHAFKMSLQSMTRRGDEGPSRKDVYLVLVEIQDLETRQVVWSEFTDVTRVAHSSILD